MPDENLERKLIKFFFIMRRVLQEKAKKEKGVSPFSFLKFATLRFISKKRNPTMKEIAQWLKITPPSATSLIDSFFKAKLIKREFDRKDRRIIRLKITEKGKKLLKETQQEHRKRMKRFISKLSPRDQKNLLRILNNFHKSLTQ
ncbi:MarR family transcriptional regulator [bacterium]|nr:MarR family transcriptional regulator [bacterium]